MHLTLSLSKINNISFWCNKLSMVNIQSIPNLLNSISFNFLDNNDLFLLGSITLETISTICIQNTNKNKLWFLPVYAGYLTSFYLFPKCLDKYSLSVAYTLWCGFGILSTNLADVLLFHKALTIRKILGSLIILYGIKIIK